jgi:hypothetical protein
MAWSIYHGEENIKADHIDRQNRLDPDRGRDPGLARFGSLAYACVIRGKRGGALASDGIEYLRQLRQSRKRSRQLTPFHEVGQITLRDRFDKRRKIVVPQPMAICIETDQNRFLCQKRMAFSADGRLQAMANAK